MGRRRRKQKLLEGIEITGIADKGKAVGRYDGKVVFVEGAVPGDLVDVRVIRKKKGHEIGVVEQFIRYSSDRKTAVCKHFGVCGGCKWQHLSYEAQLRHKQATVENALQRIGKLEISEIYPILGAIETEYYRNKLEFSFSNKRWITQEEIDTDAEIKQRNALGFHRPGAFDKIVDVEHCHLQADPSNAIRNTIRDFALENDYTFFDIKEQKGFLRTMIVRTSSLKELMLIVSFYQEDETKRKELLEMLLEKFPEITSLHYVINQKGNDTILDQDIVCYHGTGYIHEELGHVRFKIGPKSFFQTNTKQALNLYNTVLEMADLQGHENVYDLYTGIGSIACFVAHKCSRITGIEEVAAAIDDAKENAALNNLKNTSFYAGDVKDILNPEFIEKHGKPDLLITDPPRAGMHKNVVQTLLDLNPDRIVYVSCNPATQARDLNLLSEKYEVVSTKAVDMFPHTHHIENVALLKTKQPV